MVIMRSILILFLSLSFFSGEKNSPSLTTDYIDDTHTIVSKKITKWSYDLDTMLSSFFTEDNGSMDHKEMEEKYSVDTIPQRAKMVDSFFQTKSI